jgi:hypothetical protein
VPCISFDSTLSREAAGQKTPNSGRWRHPLCLRKRTLPTVDERANLPDMAALTFLVSIGTFLLLLILKAEKQRKATASEEAISATAKRALATLIIVFGLTSLLMMPFSMPATHNYELLQRLFWEANRVKDRAFVEVVEPNAMMWNVDMGWPLSVKDFVERKECASWFAGEVNGEITMVSSCGTFAVYTFCKSKLSSASLDPIQWFGKLDLVEVRALHLLSLIWPKESRSCRVLREFKQRQRVS